MEEKDMWNKSVKQNSKIFPAKSVRKMVILNEIAEKKLNAMDVEKKDILREIEGK